MAIGLIRCLLCAVIMLSTACERVPPLVEYESSGGGLTQQGIASVPIVIVGRILAHSEIGRPHPSRWDSKYPMQLYKVTVQVENVLRGDIESGTVSVFYLKNLYASDGPARMGVVGRGGQWRVGDRLIWFLRRDAGVLRTVLDTWAQCAKPVFTGSHVNYRPRPEETLAQMIVDILLDRGEGCSDQQMAEALSKSVPEGFDLTYTVKKVRRLSEDKSPEIRKAAREKLERLAYSWPQIRTGWPESGEAASHK
jgi:hypothetical protein